LGTIDNTTNQDGTSSWNGEFMQTTNRVEMIVATGSGTGEPTNSKGTVNIRGEGEMWTQSKRLANLNAAIPLSVPAVQSAFVHRLTERGS
jgi:hypothetical protein